MFSWPKSTTLVYTMVPCVENSCICLACKWFFRHFASTQVGELAQLACLWPPSKTYQESGWNSSHHFVIRGALFAVLLVYGFCSKRAWYGQTHHDFKASRQLLSNVLVSVSTFHFKQMLILNSHQNHEHSAVSLAERVKCSVCRRCCWFSTTASLSLQISFCAWPGVLALHNVRMELRRGIVRPGIEVPSFRKFHWLNSVLFIILKLRFHSFSWNFFEQYIICWVTVYVWCI